MTMTTIPDAARPDPIWFGDTLARVHVDSTDTDGRLAIVESLAPAGDMPPLHVHHREDEVFVVLEGRLSLYLPGERVGLPAGTSFRAPRGVPHTYRVESETARWLVVCEPGGFDALVRETGDPAATDDLPPRGRPQDVQRLSAAAARVGIEVLGPPGALPGQDEPRSNRSAAQPSEVRRSSLRQPSPRGSSRSR
jgi:mannose-6-phosphate isomerase-like protein (cupin superfamily)